MHVPSSTLPGGSRLRDVQGGARVAGGEGRGVLPHSDGPSASKRSAELKPLPEHGVAGRGVVLVRHARLAKLTGLAFRAREGISRRVYLSPLAFALGSLAAWVICLLVALRLRGRTFATFIAVTLGIHTVISIPLRPAFAPVQPAYDWLQLAVYVHFTMLARPRMHGLVFRALISVPAAYHVAGTFFALPWALPMALGFRPPLPYLSHALALFGVVQSLWGRESIVDVVLDGRDAGLLARYRCPASETADRPLSIVQITDPHLGPFMSTARLRRICERAVARQPDLVLITGDMLTMESQGTPSALVEAIEPLSKMRGRVFACMGNHDYEAPELVYEAYARTGVTLLMDQAVLVETASGPVQILGFEFRRSDRREAMARVCAENPHSTSVPRICLLHDPGAFKLLSDGEGELVLAGHTHGGHVGLVSLGLSWTFVHAMGKMPDHGLWAQGRNRLYVHRATGHYGFPLRWGVPSEQSLMRVRRAPE